VVPNSKRLPQAIEELVEPAHKVGGPMCGWDDGATRGTSRDTGTTRGTTTISKVGGVIRGTAGLEVNRKSKSLGGDEWGLAG
jgi:hypothetical protein